MIAPALTREYKFGFAFLDRLAMHNHVDSRKKFPVLYIRGSGETPWTVQILPYLEQGNVYHVWDITNYQRELSARSESGISIATKNQPGFGGWLGGLRFFNRNFVLTD